jgi:hypothetical protein
MSLLALRCGRDMAPCGRCRACTACPAERQNFLLPFYPIPGNLSAFSPTVTVPVSYIYYLPYGIGRFVRRVLRVTDR